MAFPSRLRIGAAVALVAMTACGDEKGYPSLQAFYSASPDQESSSSSGSSGGEPGSGVTCSIPTSGLIAYLPFDGDTSVLGGEALRASSSGPTPSFVSGQFGNALRGSSQVFLEATTSLSLPSWTACAWVRVSSSSNIGFLAVAGESALNSGVANLGLIPGCGTGAVAPYVTSRNGGCVPASGSPFAFDAWNFLCVVSDASQMRIYVDGVTASGGTSIPLSIGSGSAIAIGGGPPGSNAIDEFSLWSRALSSSEIQTLSTSRCSAGDGESP